VVYAADSEYIRKIEVSGSEEWSISSSGSYDMVVGPDGFLYVARNGDTKKFDPSDGSVVWTSDRGGYAISADNQHIYVAGSDKNLWKIDLAGSDVWHYTAGYWLYAVCALPDGSAVYIGGYPGDQHLRKISSSGNLIWQKYIKPTQNDITIGSDGILYVATANKIYKVDQDGNELAKLNSAFEALSISTAEVELATGFVTDESNNIDLSSAGIISKARYEADISWQGNIKMLVSFDNRATWYYWNGNIWVDSGGVDYTNAASIYDTMKALEGTRLEAGDTHLDFAIKGAENGFGNPKLHRIDIEYR
jgi:DNA-binding beta-propeller fold protein YncE